MFVLTVAKLGNEVNLPKFGTSLSTCFDLEFYPTQKVVEGYNKFNEKVVRYVEVDDSVSIFPGDRLLLGTGLVMKLEYKPTIEQFKDIMITTDDIDLKTYSIRLHARSGLSLKRGLVLANSEGVIDVDYQNEVFVLMTNISEVTQTIKRYDRMAQAEVVANIPFNFVEIKDVPKPHSERSGGFGSTG